MTESAKHLMICFSESLCVVVNTTIVRDDDQPWVWQKNPVVLVVLVVVVVGVGEFEVVLVLCVSPSASPQHIHLHPFCPATPSFGVDYPKIYIASFLNYIGHDD
ncbi:hypothetical protein Pmani_005220 [Petrolisthes manimaculis]|uniref:Uncharacterized protein n=1 Tax=Petrolisthes manimaculis TaxID=1843537 RepID=A0AAE1UME6_9EUCA|nr:hypothetical protein Pmani_005220 [Petrolisthes manimaculis]